MMAEPLTEADSKQVQFIQDLADGHINVEAYRYAIKGLKDGQKYPIPVPPPIMTSATRSISISGGYYLGETSEFNSGVRGC
jgi:hypothetical protein